MVAAPPNVRLEFCERIDALVRDGLDAREATKETIAALRKEGYGEEVGIMLNEVSIGIDIWRRYVGQQREDAGFPPTNTRTRYNIADLQGEGSLLETLHYVNGKWITLGDMDKATVTAAAEYWRGVAKDATEKADWLELVAARLKVGKTVREQFTDATLPKLA